MHRLLFIHFIFEEKNSPLPNDCYEQNGRTPTTTTKFVLLLYKKLPKRHDANEEKT